MSTFGITLNRLRKEHGLTQAELGDILGISYSTISMYERGEREPDFETQEAIADYFNVSMDYLHGKAFSYYDRNKESISSNIFSLQSFKKIPILGTIACGEPILAENNFEGYTRVSEETHADFALRCKGDSMTPRFVDGDIVLIRNQPIVENGQIAAIIIDNEATLKRVYIKDNQMVLSAENPDFSPIILQGEEISSARILGLAIGYTRLF